MGFPERKARRPPHEKSSGAESLWFSAMNQSTDGEESNRHKRKCPRLWHRRGYKSYFL